MNKFAMFNSILADDCSTAGNKLLHEFFLKEQEKIMPILLKMAYLTPDMKCQGCGEKIDVWHQKCSCVNTEFHTRIARLRHAALWNP